MKSILNVVALIALVAFSANVVAQETSDEKKCSKCPSQKTSTVAAKSCCSSASCDDSKTCPVSVAMAKLPKMTYTVGEKSTCCSESAAAMAKKMEKPVKYVVGEKKFDDHEKAYVSLVEQTEAQVKAFITPSKCDASGTHTVAGKSCKCSVQAGKNAELVKKAVEKVAMTYVVGKESCSCAKMAGEMAAKSGEKMTYKIGEKATCCSMEARLNLAHAKYKAAVQAMLAANTTAETSEEGTSGS